MCVLSKVAGRIGRVLPRKRWSPGLKKVSIMRSWMQDGLSWLERQEGAGGAGTTSRTQKHNLTCTGPGRYACQGC